MNRKEVEQLNDYLDDPAHHTAPDAETAEVVEQLRQQAEQVEPRPQFVQELSARLQVEVRQSNKPRSLVGWLTMRFVPRLVGAAVAVGVIAFMVWWLPQLWQTWANPEREPVLGDAIPVAERISSNRPEMFPEVPAELPLYQIEFEPLPATPEEAVAWAADFGIPDPQAFTDPHQPGMIQIFGSNEEMLLFQPYNAGMIYYSIGQEWFTGQEMNSPTAEPLPFEQAAEIAVNFLAEHDLLPADYQIFDDEAFGFEAQGGLRAVSIGPKLADAYAEFAGDAVPGATVGVTAEGQVNFALITLAQVSPGEMVPIVPAEAAYEAYQAGEIGVFMEETTGAGAAASRIQYFFPPPPEHQVGDEVEITGWPNVLVAADGSEIRATLQSPVPGVYHLVGDRVKELAEVQLIPGDVLVRGVVTAVRQPGEWELTITDWELGQPAYNSYAPFSCLKGIFSRETESTDWLTADDGTRYRLPDAPTELNEGDRIEVCSETAPEAGTEIAWTNITQPPASEQSASEGGMTMTAVEVTVEVPAAVPTATAPEAMTNTVVVEEVHSVTAPVVVERVVTAGGSGAFQLPPDTPEAQYELGESVSLTGTVDAYIFEEADGRQRNQVYLQLLNEHGLITVTLPLSGTAEQLQEMADGYFGRFLHVTGEIVPHVDWPGQGVAVGTFTAVWPEASLQNYLGHIELETMDGVETAVFVDHATDQRYLVNWKTVHFTENEPALSYPQILVSGIINPGKSVAGLPVLILRSTRYDDYIAQATDVSEFPLEDNSQVISYGPAYDPMTSAAEMVLEYMELSYISEATYDYLAAPTVPGSPPPLAEIQIARPVWLIYGRSPDGLTTYKIYVEATGN